MSSFFRHVENIPVMEGYDIIVLGAGISGISAAVAASRRGCRILLVEKLCNAGGLAAGGLISYYLPLCDGRGNIVSRGIAEELFLLATKSATGKINGNVNVTSSYTGDENRVQSFFYPAVFQTVIDAFLEANGVDILFDASADTPVMEGRRCLGVIINRREGRALYKARLFIDTTGNASVMHNAGAGSVDGKNALSGWYYTLSTDGYYELRTVGANAHEAFASVSETCGSELFNGLTSCDVSKYVKEVKKRIWKEEKNTVENGEKIIASIPSVPQLRCHRRIKGIEELGPDKNNRYCDTSVGCVSDWREPGNIYEVPFGILLSKDVDNIITAGRTVSATGDAYEVLRCIPQCAVTGEAAGTAAALCYHEKLDKFTDLEISKLQMSLDKAGVPLHYHSIYADFSNRRQVNHRWNIMPS